MSTVQLLIDMESLAHADYMTGTLNSGIPYLIEVTGTLHRSHISIDSVLLTTVLWTSWHS